MFVDISNWATILIGNTLIASLIAMIAWSCSVAFSKHPQVAHVFWWAALIKLATPSILPIPVGSWITIPSSITSPSSESMLQTSTGDPGSGSRSAGEHRSEFTEFDSEMRPHVENSETFTWFSAIAMAIVAVSFTLLLATVRRYASFGRWLTIATSVDEQLTHRLHRICRSAGLRSPANVHVIPTAMPPILWGFGKSARIVVSQSLVETLSPDCMDGILLHEAAHFQRRDHLMRLVELTIGALMWWHPLSWLARWQIRMAEERCCDAMVVAALQGREREYAATLVACTDMTAGFRPLFVSAASGFSAKAGLKSRIRAILSGRTQARLGRMGSMLTLSAALTLFAVSFTARAEIPAAPITRTEIRLRGFDPNDDETPRLTSTEPQDSAGDEIPGMLTAEEIPAELNVVHSRTFPKSPRATLTAATLSRGDALDVSDLHGCWGLRDRSSLLAELTLGVSRQLCAVYVFSKDGFELQNLLEINNVPVAIFHQTGTYRKVGDHQIEFTFDGPMDFQMPPFTPPSPEVPDGIIPRDTMRVAVEGDLMTMISEYDDGTSESFVFRRFDCPDE